MIADADWRRCGRHAVRRRVRASSTTSLECAHRWFELPCALVGRLLVLVVIAVIANLVIVVVVRTWQKAWHYPRASISLLTHRTRTRSASDSAVASVR